MSVNFLPLPKLVLLFSFFLFNETMVLVVLVITAYKGSPLRVIYVYMGTFTVFTPLKKMFVPAATTKWL